MVTPITQMDMLFHQRNCIVGYMPLCHWIESLTHFQLNPVHVSSESSAEFV